MIELVLTNRKVLIEGADPELTRELEAATSYVVAGHWFSPAFKAHRWDGKERLLKHGRDGMSVPAGLFGDIVEVLKRLGERFRVTKRTSIRSKRVQLAWNDAVVM